MTPLLRLALSLVCAVALAAAVRLYASPPGQGEAAPLILFQLPTDEAQTLALERAVNSIRVNVYHQPERVPSSKLRRIAGTWKVIYTANAAAIEPTTLYGLVYDTVRDATFDTTEIYYSTFDMAGAWTPEQIAAYWQVGPENWYIYQTPLHAGQGCGYRYKAGRTQAFCIYGTEWEPLPPGTPTPIPTPTATASPVPLRLPPQPTGRPLPTRTPTPIWRR